jgi:hypothetical protein
MDRHLTATELVALALPVLERLDGAGGAAAARAGWWALEHSRRLFLCAANRHPVYLSLKIVEDY